MQTTRRAFLFALLLSALFLSSAKAYAQTGVSYRFLEVLDTEGKPVAGAKVETVGGPPGPKQTDERGQIRELPVYIGDYNTRDFKVSKKGYLTYEGDELFDTILYRAIFEDLFTNYASSAPMRVVLWREPVTAAERKAVKAEQRRRELLLAVKRNDAATVEKFLRQGVGPDVSNFDGVPAILYAAANGNGAMVKALLAAGADVRNKGKPGHKALAFYLSRFTTIPDSVDMETVRSLIKAGADVNAAIKYGSTVLGYAKQSNNPELVKLLEEAGAR